MKHDGKNMEAIMPATTLKKIVADSGRDSGTTKEATKKYKGVLDVLWAVMGLKMALDRLASLKFSVVATHEKDSATITVNFGGLNVDLNSGTVNGKDLDGSIVAIQETLKKLQGDSGNE